MLKVGLIGCGFMGTMHVNCYKNIPGVTYLVYPGGADDLMPSLREKQLCEAVNDYRALRLLESLIGREETLALCERFFGGKIDILTLPASSEQMRNFRETLNDEIDKHIQYDQQ